MSRYAKEIECIEIITNEEVNELVNKMNNGDISARNKLIEHNLVIIKAVALKYANMYELSLEDYISIGTIGLITAINKYDPNSLVNIKTFAYSCANNYIKCYLRHLTAEKRNYTNDISIHTYYLETGNKTTGTLEEVLPYDGPSVEDVIISRLRLEKLRVLINQLPEPHKQTMYMLYGCKHYNVREASEITGMSSQAISYRRCSAIKKLKKHSDIEHIL